MTETHRANPTYVEDQREFFDQLVTVDWDSYQSEAWDRAREFEVAELFELISPRSVLDVGCGVGFHDLVMARDHGVKSVLGIDYSKRSIEVAEDTYPHPAVRREVADVFELPAGEFDLAVSFQVIEHLTDPDTFLRACANQVRPGGWVACFTPNRMRANNRILRLRGRPEELADPQHYREYTAKELRAVGSAAGLDPAGSFGYGLSLIVPKLDWRLIRGSGLRLGRALPPLAEGICEVFRVRSGR